MSDRATLEGTKRYAKSFQTRAADGYFREAQGLVLSSLGIGTYLGQPDERTDAAYTAAAVTAAENGMNVMDAAINYRFQRSERSIGAALVQLEERGYSRNQLFLARKPVSLPPDAKIPADPNRYFFEEYIQRGIFSAKDIAAGSHCIAPRFLQDQLARSLANFGVNCIDVYSEIGQDSRQELHLRNFDELSLRIMQVENVDAIYSEIGQAGRQLILQKARSDTVAAGGDVLGGKNSALNIFNAKFFPP